MGFFQKIEEEIRSHPNLPMKRHIQNVFCLGFILGLIVCGFLVPVLYYFSGTIQSSPNKEKIRTELTPDSVLINSIQNLDLRLKVLEKKMESNKDKQEKE